MQALKRMILGMCLLSFILPLLNRGGGQVSSTDESGTLVFVAFTKDAVILAADSAVTTNGKVVRVNARKLMQVGRLGGLVIAGTTLIGNASRGEVSLQGKIAQCARQSSDIAQCAQCTTESITAALPATLKFQDSNQELLLGIYFGGYIDRSQSFELVEFFFFIGQL